MSTENESILVIVPTYNEIVNIKKIIPAIFKQNPEAHILVVDDNSPDGTGSFVSTEHKEDQRVHLLARKNKEGLGKAYLAGMSWALNNNYDFLVQMDADFSHRPVDLKSMIDSTNGSDLVIGSRWVNGGSVVNWGLLRKFISKFGSFYASTILNKPIKDWTGGFNLWRCSKLKEIDFNNVTSNGYSFQIEMKYLALTKKFKHQEHPIQFVDRVDGISKMSKKIILEALVKVWKFRSIHKN